jgi:hypothetical protein
MEKGSVLITEGRDDLHVITSLCEILNIPEEFKIKDGEGFENIIKILPILFKFPNFGDSIDINRLGIVIDADADINSRWASITQILRDNNYDLPLKPETSGIVTTNSSNIIPVVGVWVMPDNKGKGMIEDFFRYFIPADDLLLPHINSTIDQLNSDPFSYIPQPRSKAEIRTWLAWQKKSESLMGYTLHNKKDQMNFDNDISRKFMNWLQRLFEFELIH